MTDSQPAWTEGYVAEIEYTSGFYAEQAPAHLALAAHLARVQAPAIDRPFAYFEMACGQGLTSNLLAAANPQGHFFANDFNPTHILNARRLAAEAGIGNVTFLEKSFAELAEVELPEFDFITLHGIYSWVSAENRRAIVDFIRRKLKPGGVVYVSYNCLPGWAAMAPLRRLMWEHAARQSGPMPAKVAAALEFAEKLDKAGARYFAANQQIRPRLEKMRKQSPNYLVHEYLNMDWELLYHADVVRDMAAAKLSFAGSAHFAEQIDELVAQPQARPLLDGVSDPVLRETVKDFLINQQFRRDVFVRGAPRLSARTQREVMTATRFVLAVPRDACTLAVRVPVGQVKLPEATFAPILDALAAGPRTAQEIAAPKSADGTAQAWRRLAVLAAVGYARPAAPADAEARASTTRFNDAVLRRIIGGDELNMLASPVLGSGTRIDLVHRLFLAALHQRHEDIVAFAWQWLSGRHQVLRKDGKPLQGAEENRQELARLADDFAGKTLPLLRRLGVTAGGPGAVEARVVHGGQGT